jgi:hypothetical protein
LVVLQQPMLFAVLVVLPVAPFRQRPPEEFETIVQDKQRKQLLEQVSLTLPGHIYNQLITNFYALHLRALFA